MRPRPITWVALAACIAAAVTLLPLWPPLVLAGWFAMVCRPITRKLDTLLRGRARAAGLVTVALLVLIVAPLVLAVASLYGATVQLAENLRGSADVSAMLRALVQDGDKTGAEAAKELDPRSVVKLAEHFGGQAWSVAGKVLGVTAGVVIGVFVFLYGTFVFLVRGDALAGWIEAHAPISRSAVRRLGAAFEETGRGLLIGTGLTAAAQGAVACGIYLVLGVPRAILLGFLTALAALIPSVGSGLVWVPVAAGLALTGRTTAAIVMAALGLLVIGTIDNVVRPIFSRFGRLNMPTFLILVSIFGGLAVFGMFGVILGPLLVRLAIEALELLRESRDETRAQAEPRARSVEHERMSWT